MVEYMLNRPGTDRNVSSIARMNWLHSRYRKAGKITDEDMLYVLGLFALEPKRWINSMEWRELNDLELCALGVSWKKLGETMDISYDRLPTSSSGWGNGLQWLLELEKWCDGYEVEHMVSDPTNHNVATITLDLALTNVPKFLKPLTFQFICALLGPRLRQAVQFESPAPWVEDALGYIIAFRKAVLRSLSLPRPRFMRVLRLSDADSKTGKFHAKRYIAHPWYISPSIGQRWSLKSWFLWITGGYVPSSTYSEYRPEGYRINELGPIQFEGHGLGDMEIASHMIREIQGCPFH
jgi:hypothetical protein